MTKRKSGKTKVFLGAMGLFSLCFASSCSGQNVRGSYYAFDTLCDIYLYDSEAAYLDELSDYFETFSAQCDNYNNYESSSATIYRINQEANEGKPMEVSQDLFDCLSFAKEMQDKTDGLFNPLVGNLSKLWKESIDPTTPQSSEEKPVDPYLPDPAEIENCLEEIRSSEFILDEENLTVTRKGNATLDLGGIAKGFALRHANSYLAEKGCGKYRINLGRSSLSFGLYSDGSAYEATLTDGDGNAVLKLYDIANTSMAVSGSTEQKALIEGKLYTHIVNPITGEAEAKYDLVAVSDDDPALCDVISTTMMLLDVDEAAELAEECELDCYLIYKDGEVLARDGFRIEEA